MTIGRDNTHRSEIYVETQYLEHEQNLRSEILDVCREHGYQTNVPGTPETVNQTLIRGDRKIYLSIVDDVRGMDLDRLGLLTANDLVITDNYFYRPLRCRVLYLPKSWYGIYHYVPKVDCAPDRILTLALNRANPERVHIFLDTVQMLKHPSMFVDEDMTNTYLSFNSVPKNRNLPAQCSTEEKLAAWHQEYSLIWFDDISYIQPFHQSLTESGRIPFCNHDLDFDQVQQRGLLNMTVETYAFDEAVSFSEKTFRALMTPRPWSLFASRYAIGHLRNMGFDVMDDILDHRHDELPLGQLKIIEYVRNSVHQAHYLCWKNISQRCHEAAQHNQSLLKSWKKHWHRDQKNWFQELSRYISSAL